MRYENNLILKQMKAWRRKKSIRVQKGGRYIVLWGAGQGGEGVCCISYHKYTITAGWSTAGQIEGSYKDCDQCEQQDDKVIHLFPDRFFAPN